MTNVHGWAIFAINRKDGGLLFPLAYGDPHQIEPQALLDRGRIQLFWSEKEAKDALKKSLKGEDANGSTWHKTCDFQFMPICTQAK